MMSPAPILGVLLVFCGQPAEKPAAPEAMVLTIDDAARLAAEKNRTVLQAQEGIAAAQAALRQAKAVQSYSLRGTATVTALGPTPSVTFPIGNGQSQTIKLAPNLNWQAQLTLAQPVTRGGAFYWQEALARQGIDAATFQRDAQLLQVTSSVRQLFLQVLQAQQLEQVAAENVSRAATHLQEARARVEAGTAPGYDAIRAEADVENANNGLVAAHGAVEQGLAALKTLLVIDVMAPVRLESPKPGAAASVDVADAIRASGAHRPEVRAVDTALRMAQTRVRLADTAKNPNVDVFATYSREASSGFGGIGWGWTVGVQASQLIFDHGLTRAQVQEAQAAVRQADEAAKQTREGIALQVYQAWVSLRQAAEQITDGEKGAAAAEEAMRIADLSYREGVATPVQVTDARTALLAAHANLVNARFGYELARVALEYATGMPLADLTSGGAKTGLAPAAGEAAPKPAPEEAPGPRAALPSHRYLTSVVPAP
jgi:outer membrane protein TolC